VRGSVTDGDVGVTAASKVIAVSEVVFIVISTIRAERIAVLLRATDPHRSVICTAMIVTVDEAIAIIVKAITTLFIRV